MNIKDLEFPDNFPAPPEHLLELGRITALWGSLESTVDLALTKLSGIEDIDGWRVHVLTVHSNFKQRVDAIETLCHKMQEQFPQLQMYKDTIKAIRKAQSKRNQFLHNGIYFNTDNGNVETSSMQARGVLKTKVETITVDDLKNVSALIHLALLSLHELVTGVKYPPVWERD